MFFALRLPLFAAGLLILTACQMETPQSPETFKVERIARTMGIVESCRSSECGRLNLDSGALEDYSVIADMTHVTALMTSYTDFDDLSDIAPMTQLRELHIGATRVNDLSGLSNFPNLKVLHAQQTSTTDFSAIRQMRGLEELAVGYEDLGDLSFVQGLNRLKSLNLTNSTITSFSVLRNHPTLEVLDLGDATFPADFSALTTIPNLREISIADWTLSDEQRAIIDQLRSSGVTVNLTAAIIVC